MTVDQNQKKTALSRDSSQQASFFQPGRRNEHNEVSQSVTTVTAESLENDLDEVAIVRRRLHRAIGKRDRDLAVRVCSREYLPAVDQLRETYPREVLASERDALLARMERGWVLDTTPSRFRTFQKLLSRYEVIEDCLAGDVMSATFDRLDRVSA